MPKPCPIPTDPEQALAIKCAACGAAIDFRRKEVFVGNGGASYVCGACMARAPSRPRVQARKTVKPGDIGVGFYVAFGSDLGMVGFFKVVDSGEYGLTVWGLSRWKGNIGYRTLGIRLEEWLGRQHPGVQFRRDRDRSGWQP